jgi:hypothetical protein
MLEDPFREMRVLFLQLALIELRKGEKSRLRGGKKEREEEEQSQ